MHHSSSLKNSNDFKPNTPSIFLFYLSTLYSFSKSIINQQHLTNSMANFTPLPSVRNSISWPTMLVPNMSDNTSSLRNKGIYKGQRNLRDSNVANVASPLPVIAPPTPEERPPTSGSRHHHVAWTSIPQERWEGELHVQGQIPLWLVSLH